MVGAAPTVIFYVHESRVQGKCIAIPTRTTSFSKEKGATLGFGTCNSKYVSMKYIRVNEVHVYSPHLCVRSQECNALSYMYIVVFSWFYQQTVCLAMAT